MGQGSYFVHVVPQGALPLYFYICFGEELVEVELHSGGTAPIKIVTSTQNFRS